MYRGRRLTGLGYRARPDASPAVPGPAGSRPVVIGDVGVHTILSARGRRSLPRPWAVP
jgi:hypothetical protein